MIEVFKDGEIIVEAFNDFFQMNASKEKVHYQVRRALMDGYLPLPKVIGFLISRDSSRGPNSNLFEGRSQGIKETHLELMTNLAKVVFIPTNYGVKTMVPDSLKLTPKRPDELSMEIIEKTHCEHGVFTKAKTVQEVLDENVYLCTTSLDTEIHLLTGLVQGNITLSQSVEMMDELLNANTDEEEENRSNDAYIRYKGVTSRASLSEYVRFIPQGGGLYTYKLRNGATDDKINILWNTYMEVTYLDKSYI